MNLYSPMLVFGITVFPPFALILRRVSGISSTLKGMLWGLPIAPPLG